MPLHFARTFVAVVGAVVLMTPFFSQAVVARAVSSSFLYDFHVAGTLEEAGSEAETSSPYFWLNSGGLLHLYGGLGRTVHGPLPADNKWRLMYANANPLDTGNGYYPQNLFRFITRSKWQNVRAEMAFKINITNMTDSPNRDAHNAVLLMARYVDSANLYYAGIRVDGYAVIKKKVGGRYYTLAMNNVFANGQTYSRTSNPNLIPKNKWMKIRVETVNNPNGSVGVKLFLDKDNNNSWTQVASVVDSGTSGPVVGSPGRVGIRTDFMDVEFDNLRMTNI